MKHTTSKRYERYEKVSEILSTLILSGGFHMIDHFQHYSVRSSLFYVDRVMTVTTLSNGTFFLSLY